MRALGRVVLYGEGFWRRALRGLLAALGGATIDELSDYDGLRAAISDAGFDIAQESVASEDDWARYEEKLAANAERHGTPDTPRLRAPDPSSARMPGGTEHSASALFALRA